MTEKNFRMTFPIAGFASPMLELVTDIFYATYMDGYKPMTLTLDGVPTPLIEVMEDGSIKRNTCSECNCDEGALINEVYLKMEMGLPR